MSIILKYRPGDKKIEKKKSTRPAVYVKKTGKKTYLPCNIEKEKKFPCRTSGQVNFCPLQAYAHKESQMRIKLRIKLINSHNLLKNSFNLLKFALHTCIKEVNIDISMSPKHDYLSKYLKY